MSLNQPCESCGTTPWPEWAVILYLAIFAGVFIAFVASMLTHDVTGRWPWQWVKRWLRKAKHGE